MQRVQGICKITTHAKYVHVIVKPTERLISGEIITTSTYGELKPQSGWVGVCLHNLSSKEVILPAKKVLGHIHALNIVPPMLVPHYIKGEKQPGTTQTCLTQAIPEGEKSLERQV